MRMTIFILFLFVTALVTEDLPQPAAPAPAAPATDTPAPLTDSSKAPGAPSKEFEYSRDERMINEDGTEKVIWRETDEQRADPYDPYKRFNGDSAKSQKTREKQVHQAFPEARKEEAEKKAARAARPEEVKQRERELLNKQPVLQDKINPTIKERGSIPKRF
ncbi:MAG: hypothetical protein SGI98_06160 [Verrucomicrobiota bacterium]|nr:hypothetical protein [Verrucomicrobiota bacterium]